MKYFTPELYVRGNSPVDAVADQAEKDWEDAIARYEKHYQAIASRLPDALRRFHDECCLHDAEVFAPAVLSNSAQTSAAGQIVIVTQNVNTLVPEHLNTQVSLHYVIVEEPSIRTPLESEWFHEGSPTWLYDEIDLDESGAFSHEILLSTGRVIRLRFLDFSYEVARIVAPIYARCVKPRNMEKLSA